jgi:hypothetical protein
MSEQDKDDNKKPIKIVFAEGCFDDFEGTQEELDELVAQLTEMAEDGSLLEKSVAVDVEDVEDEVLDLLPLLSTGNLRH